MSHLPDGTPFRRQFFVELLRGGDSFRLCRQDAGRGYTHTHSRCNFEWTNYLDGKSDCFVCGPGSGFRPLKAKGGYIRSRLGEVEDDKKKAKIAAKGVSVSTRTSIACLE